MSKEQKCTSDWIQTSIGRVSDFNPFALPERFSWQCTFDGEVRAKQEDANCPGQFDIAVELKPQIAALLVDSRVRIDLSHLGFMIRKAVKDVMLQKLFQYFTINSDISVCDRYATFAKFNLSHFFNKIDYIPNTVLHYVMWYPVLEPNKTLAGSPEVRPKNHLSRRALENGEFNLYKTPKSKGTFNEQMYIFQDRKAIVIDPDLIHPKHWAHEFIIDLEGKVSAEIYGLSTPHNLPTHYPLQHNPAFCSFYTLAGPTGERHIIDCAAVIEYRGEPIVAIPSSESYSQVIYQSKIINDHDCSTGDSALHYDHAFMQWLVAHRKAQKVQSVKFDAVA